MKEVKENRLIENKCMIFPKFPHNISPQHISHKRAPLMLLTQLKN